MKVLAIDIGGTNVKFLANGESTHRRFPSGRKLTPAQMVAQVQKLARDWDYNAVSIGYPGPVDRGRPTADPRNLAKGWVNFNFAGRFKRPVKIVNDASMQALGSYKGGTMLFLGLGTGIGAAIVVGGFVVPLELARVPYKNGTFETYLGAKGLRRLGKKKWQRHVEQVTAALISAIHPDDVVLGGGNVKKLKALPPGCRAGHNAFAFLGGFLLWGEELQALEPSAQRTLTPASASLRKSKTPPRARAA
jgi:polyphosphate glucokinase